MYCSDPITSCTPPALSRRAGSDCLQAPTPPLALDLSTNLCSLLQKGKRTPDVYISTSHPPLTPCSQPLYTSDSDFPASVLVLSHAPPDAPHQLRHLFNRHSVLPVLPRFVTMPLYRARVSCCLSMLGTMTVGTSI